MKITVLRLLQIVLVVGIRCGIHCNQTKNGENEKSSDLSSQSHIQWLADIVRSTNNGRHLFRYVRESNVDNNIVPTLEKTTLENEVENTNNTFDESSNSIGGNGDNVVKTTNQDDSNNTVYDDSVGVEGSGSLSSTNDPAADYRTTVIMSSELNETHLFTTKEPVSIPEQTSPSELNNSTVNITKTTESSTVSSTKPTSKTLSTSASPAPILSPKPPEKIVLTSTTAEPTSTNFIPSVISTSEPMSTSEIISSDSSVTSELQTNISISTSPEPFTSAPEFEVTSEPSTAEPEVSTEPSTAEPEASTEPSTAEPEASTEPSTAEPEASTEPSTAEPESSSEPSTPESSAISETEPSAKTEPSTPEPTITPEPSSSEPEVSSEPYVTPEPSTPEPSIPEPSSPEPSTPEPSKPEPSSPEPYTPEPSSSEPTNPEPSSPEPYSPAPESEPEPEPSPEPETNPEPETEPEAETSFSEPRPDWIIAKQDWGWWWEFMVYLFGVLFLLLGIFSFLSVLRLWGMNHLLSRNYFLTLNILVIMNCILRAAYLLVDAHNTKETFHTVVDYFLYSTAFPCLTSAFSILFYALLIATKMQVISPKIQKLSILIGIIVFHFALSIITDIVVGLVSEAKVLLLVCQFFYILWGVILFAGYFYLFNRLYSAAMKRQKTLAQQTTTISHHSKKIKMPKYTIGLSIKVTFVGAICGLGCVALELYGVFGVYKIYLSNFTPEPWPWWIYHFSLRLMEFLMCCIMVYVASQPIKYRRRDSGSVCFLCWIPIKRVCCSCRNDLSNDSADTWTNSDAHVMCDSRNDHNIVKVKYAKNYEDDINIKQTVVPEAQDSCKKQIKESHLVIEDGMVRFRSKDEIGDDEFEVGSSLPDLVNGNVIRMNTGNFDLGVGSGIPQGVLNSGYFRSDSMENDRSQQTEHCAINSAETQRKYGNSADVERTSIGTTGTSGTDGAMHPMSSLNLADSMEWEFEQAYERSFIADDDNSSVKSLPSNIPPMSPRESNHLLSDADQSGQTYIDQSTSRDDSYMPQQNRVSFSLGQNSSVSSSEGPNSPTRKPLIKRGRQSSSDRDIGDSTLNRFKTNIYL